jgi:hypothetical protein
MSDEKDTSVVDQVVTGADDEISAETMANLTEEERAALAKNEGPLTPEEESTLGEIAKEPPVKTQGAEAGGKEAVAAPENAAAVEAPAAVAAETDSLMPVIAADEQIEVPANIPPVSFRFRDDGKILPEFEGQFSALDDKYEAGEVTLREYNQQRDALRADMLAVKQDSQLWQAECETFWKHNPQWRPGGVLFDMLNGEVIRIASSEQGKTLAGIEVIYAAQARVEKAVASVRGGKQPEPAKPDADKGGGGETDKRPTAERPDLKTLGGLPAAESPETQGEFGYLDNLEGMELEAAVNELKKDPHKFQRWLNQ